MRILLIIFIFHPLMVSGQDVTALINNPTCVYSEDGSIDLVLNTSQYAPYTYEWTQNHGNGPEFLSNNQDIFHLSGLYEYCVTVTNIICGKATLCFELSAENENPFYISNFHNAIDCSGTNDGFISIANNLENLSIHEPISYSWSGPNFSSSSQNITGLAPGLYTVTITTNSGCEFLLSKFICCCNYDDYYGPTNPSECPDPLSNDFVITGNVTNVSHSGGNDGAIDLMIFDNFSEPIYTWFNSEIDPNGYFSFEQDLNNLQSGTYYVTVTDGCETETAQFIVGNQSCYNSSGDLSLAITDFTIYHAFSQDNWWGYTHKGAIDLEIYSENGYSLSVIDQKTGQYVNNWDSNPYDISGLAAGKYVASLFDLSTACIVT